MTTIKTKEPVSRRTMKIDKNAFERAAALLNLPDYAMFSEDDGIRQRAEDLHAKQYEHALLGCADFEDGVNIQLWLCSDNKGYYASWNVLHPAKRIEKHEVLMLLPSETIIAHRWRYVIDLDIE